jgi:hypothetical protein
MRIQEKIINSIRNSEDRMRYDLYKINLVGLILTMNGKRNLESQRSKTNDLIDQKKQRGNNEFYYESSDYEFKWKKAAYSSSKIVMISQNKNKMIKEDKKKEIKKEKLKEIYKKEYIQESSDSNENFNNNESSEMESLKQNFDDEKNQIQFQK